jgi:tetratricopeptide (TPR) repeat protein
VLPQSDDPWVHLEAAMASERVGYTLMALGRLPEAATAYRRALEVIGPLVDAQSAVLQHARQLITVYHRLALCYSLLGRSDQAEAVQWEAATRCERLAASHPEQPDYRRGLANTYNNLANSYETAGRLADGVVYHGKNVRLLAEHHQETR